MGFFSSIGGILGGIGGAFLGGPVGAVIGSGLGGSVGSAVDGNSANKQAQGYYNSQMDFAREQAQFQQDYAKNVMQWRVEDAKKAGIHPLAALGVSNPSYSPVSSPSAPAIQDSSAFDTGSEFGQNLNRASFQAKTQAQQLQSARLGMEQINLQNRGLELDNDFKMLQIQQLASQLQNAAASSAPSPEVNAKNPISGSPSPFMDKPIVRDGWLMDERGRKIGIIPSEPLSSRTEDKLVVEWIPWAGSAVRAFKGKWLGQEVAGHWWHGEDKGFLPYPPQKRKGFFGHASDAINFYRDYGD